MPMIDKQRWLSVAIALAAAAIAAATAGAGRASAPGEPEWTVTPSRGLVGSFGGFGGQFNQHVFADISGPPPNLPALESKVLALEPRYVRVFFNNSEWTLPDRMESFVRTVHLASRAGATIEIAWQGGTFAFAMLNMPRLADVIAELFEHQVVVRPVWVSLYNEPNSAMLSLPQFEATYRLLDSELRARGVRDRVHFMGGGILAAPSGLGQTQADWYRYMAEHMGDLLDAWAPHIYWDFWDTPKIERRLSEVRAIFATIPEELRRPLYVTEFGVRGLRTFEGELTYEPGFYPDGAGVAATTTAALEEAWLMIRSTQLGYVAASKWDVYDATYDIGTQDFSTIGAGADGWPIRPSYNLLQLLTLTTSPVGGSIVDVVPATGADPKKLLTAYIAPSGDMTILGLDTDGTRITAGWDPIVYKLGGLPATTRFRLLVWNADGSGRNVDIGFVDTNAAGQIELSVPVQGVFALTTVPLGSLPW
jgi:hypothetical protein